MNNIFPYEVLVTDLRIIPNIEMACMDNSPTPTLSVGDSKYNIKYYYERQADFEQEGDEEISG